MTRQRHLVTEPIAKGLWTFGYTWVLAGKDSSLRAQAAAEAAAAAADVVVYREEGAELQYGLGFLTPRDRSRGMAAAVAFAAHLASRKRATTGLGLFQLPTRQYWISTIQDGAIDADHGDLLFDDFKDALGTFARIVTSRYWDHIYAPQHVVDDARQLPVSEISGEEALHFARILSRTQSARTIPVDTSALATILLGMQAPLYIPRAVRRADILSVFFNRYAMFGMAAVTVGILLYVGPALLHPPPSPPRPVVLAPAQPPSPPKEVPPPPIDTPPPSIAAALPSQWLRACYEAIAHLDDSTPWGWQSKKVSCDGATASIYLTRTEGFLEDVKATYRSSQIVWGDNYEIATIVNAMTVPAVPRNETLAQPEAIRQRLFSAGLRLQENISVERFAAPKTRDQRDQARWLSTDFTVTTPTLPTIWGRYFDTVPGLVITGLSIDTIQLREKPSAARWLLKGEIYAQ